MKWFANTLWDLLDRSHRDEAKPAPTRRPRSAPSSRQAQYDQLVLDMKREWGIRVRKWRSSTSGCAWMVYGADGSSARLIEAPYPRGPVSCAVFLHEVGHHAIGFNTHRLRCMEEYAAWQWALNTMRERGLHVSPSVQRRYHDAMVYAVAKARRRGLKRLPAELVEFLGEGAKAGGHEGTKADGAVTAKR